jgi:hypothetical protein
MREKTSVTELNLFPQMYGEIKIQVLHTECSQVNVSGSSNQSYASLPSPILLPSIIGQNSDLVLVILQKRKGNPSKFEQAEQNKTKGGNLVTPL